MTTLGNIKKFLVLAVGLLAFGSIENASAQLASDFERSGREFDENQDALRKVVEGTPHWKDNGKNNNANRRWREAVAADTNDRRAYDTRTFSKYLSSYNEALEPSKLEVNFSEDVPSGYGATSIYDFLQGADKIPDAKLDLSARQNPLAITFQATKGFLASEKKRLGDATYNRMYGDVEVNEGNPPAPTITTDENGQQVQEQVVLPSNEPHVADDQEIILTFDAGNMAYTYNGLVQTANGAQYMTYIDSSEIKLVLEAQAQSGWYETIRPGDNGQPQRVAELHIQKTTRPAMVVYRSIDVVPDHALANANAVYTSVKNHDALMNRLLTAPEAAEDFQESKGLTRMLWSNDPTGAGFSLSSADSPSINLLDEAEGTMKIVEGSDSHELPWACDEDAVSL